MASKATQEYRVAFITLLTQLSDIERRGQEFFEKIEQSPWVPYDASTAQHDFEQLEGALQELENHAKACGLLSITGTPEGEEENATRTLATRNAETLQAVDTFFQEKNRLLMNIRAANAVRRSN